MIKNIAHFLKWTSKYVYGATKCEPLPIIEYSMVDLKVRFSSISFSPGGVAPFPPVVELPLLPLQEHTASLAWIS